MLRPFTTTNQRHMQKTSSTNRHYQSSSFLLQCKAARKERTDSSKPEAKGQSPPELRMACLEKEASPGDSAIKCINNSKVTFKKQKKNTKLKTEATECKENYLAVPGKASSRNSPANGNLSFERKKTLEPAKK
jgi:hypothetical protein